MYFIQKSKNSRQILQISNHKNPEPVVKTPISIIYIGFCTNVNLNLFILWISS